MARTYGERMGLEIDRAIPDYTKLILELKISNPPITKAGVLRDGPIGMYVRCVCGNEFEYLKDQVLCTRCRRLFDPYSALDLIDVDLTDSSSSSASSTIKTATVHFFKGTTYKWYTEEEVPWQSTQDLIHEEFVLSLKMHLEGRLKGMLAVCLESPHEHSCPIAVIVE